MVQVIPSHEITEKLTALLTFVRNDYESQLIKTDSFLYKMFGEGSYFNKRYFDQLVASLITKPTDPGKHLEIRLGWDIERKTQKGVKVYMDLENKNKDNFIGTAQGRYAPGIGSNTYEERFMQSFTSTCGILIHSNNVMECELLYEFFKLALIPLIPRFESQGCMRNISIGGNSVTFNGEIPEGIYTKVITMTFDYEQQMPELIAKGLLTGITTTLTLTTEI